MCIYSGSGRRFRKVTKYARAESMQQSSQGVCAVSASPNTKCEVHQHNTKNKPIQMQSDTAKAQLTAEIEPISPRAAYHSKALHLSRFDGAGIIAYASRTAYQTLCGICSPAHLEFLLYDAIIYLKKVPHRKSRPSPWCSRLSRSPHNPDHSE